MSDVVNVKPGYARTFCCAKSPSGDSEPQNEGQRRNWTDNLQRQDEAQSVADRLDGLSVVIIRSAGDSGQLYGSGMHDISEVVTEAGFRNPPTGHRR